jgi:hypothetical protein
MFADSHPLRRRRSPKNLPKTCKSGSHRPVAPRSRIHGGFTLRAVPCMSSQSRLIFCQRSLQMLIFGNQAMKKATLAALAMSLSAATSIHAEKPTAPQTELIINLAVITAGVDRCHFEVDSRIIGLDLVKDLMLIDAWQTPANRHCVVRGGRRGSRGKGSAGRFLTGRTRTDGWPLAQRRSSLT